MTTTTQNRVPRRIPIGPTTSLLRHSWPAKLQVTITYLFVVSCLLLGLLALPCFLIGLTSRIGFATYVACWGLASLLVGTIIAIVLKSPVARVPNLVLVLHEGEIACVEETFLGEREQFRIPLPTLRCLIVAERQVVFVGDGVEQSLTCAEPLEVARGLRRFLLAERDATLPDDTLADLFDALYSEKVKGVSPDRLVLPLIDRTLTVEVEDLNLPAARQRLGFGSAVERADISGCAQVARMTLFARGRLSRDTQWQAMCIDPEYAAFLSPRKADLTADGWRLVDERAFWFRGDGAQGHDASLTDDVRQVLGAIGTQHAFALIDVAPTRVMVAVALATPLGTLRSLTKSAGRLLDLARDEETVIPDGCSFVIDGNVGAGVAICRLCGTAVELVTARRCPRCETLHHEDCWEYNGGCTVYACNAGSLRTGSTPDAAHEMTRRNERFCDSLRERGGD